MTRCVLVRCIDPDLPPALHVLEDGRHLGDVCRVAPGAWLVVAAGGRSCGQASTSADAVAALRATPQAGGGETVAPVLEWLEGDRAIVRTPGGELVGLVAFLPVAASLRTPGGPRSAWLGFRPAAPATSAPWPSVGFVTPAAAACNVPDAVARALMLAEVVRRAVASKGAAVAA